MTDLPSAGEPEWLPVLRDVARGSGHGMRNALNGLVVNLEVVRRLTAGAEGSHGPAATFVAQAVQQSEQSVRLAESTIALLNLVVSAIGSDGVVRCELAGPHAIRITAPDGPAVILTIPDDSSARTT